MLNIIQENDKDLKSAISYLKNKLPNKNVKKILLVNPPDGDVTMFRTNVAKRGRYNNNPPYGLGVLASIARQIGVEVEISNLNIIYRTPKIIPSKKSF